MYYRYFPFPKKHTIFLEKAYYLFRKSTHPFWKKITVKLEVLFLNAFLCRISKRIRIVSYLYT